MKKIIVILLLICLGIFSFAQQNSLEVLSQKMAFHAADFPKNKVFISTDKDIYGAGEKIWFKAEILNCLSEKKANETELVLMIKAESGEIIYDNKYLIENGEVNHQITIPGWAPEGNAFLVLYTPKALNVNEASLAAIKPITINTLKNNDYLLSASLNADIFKPGEELKLSLQLQALTPSNKKEKFMVTLFDYQKEVYSKKVSLNVNQVADFKFKIPSEIEEGLFFEIQSTGKNNISLKKPIPTTHDRLKVEFFPEGGKLLSNNIQRIVYRVTDPFGKPADISGFVYDELNHQVGVGKILKNGFGMISLMPMPTQTYTFRPDSNYGKGQKFVLPEVELNGCSFMLVKTETDGIKAVINNTGEIIGQNLTVAAIAQGEVKMVFDIEAKQKNNLQISTKELPIGIITFLVINAKGKILSERMIYNAPFEDINIDISTELILSDLNGEVEITINALNFIQRYGKSTMDIKVVDQQNLYNSSQDKSYNFLRYPLLTPIPKTVLDIYLTNIELIANKSRYFLWQEILDNVNYLLEKGTGKNFSGTVSDKNGDKIPNATVMVIHPNNPTLATTNSDAKGKFMFSNIPKSNDMVVKAISENGKKTYQVHIDRSFDETLDEMLLLESFNVNPRYSISETPNYYANNQHLLKLAGSENKINKPKEDSNSQKMLQSGATVLDVIRMIKPFTIKENQIVFYGSTNSLLNQQGALILIDGQKMGTHIVALESVNPHEIVSVNVSTNPVEIHEHTALNSIGIIDIRTRGSEKLGTGKELPLKPIPSEFHPEDFPHEVWKYQSTLYWKPNLPISNDGLIHLKLKLSELKTVFVVQVDVTSEKGVSHRQISTFSTKE